MRKKAPKIIKTILVTKAIVNTNKTFGYVSNSPANPPLKTITPVQRLFLCCNKYSIIFSFLFIENIIAFSDYNGNTLIEFYIYPYIFSGAVTHIISRAFFKTIFVARTSDNRAFIMDLSSVITLETV